MSGIISIQDILAVEEFNTSNRRRLRIHRPIRDRCNPLHEWDDVEFFQRFRMRKDGFQYVFSLIEPQLAAFPTNRNCPIPKILQLAITMRCYANGALLVPTYFIWSLLSKHRVEHSIRKHFRLEQCANACNSCDNMLNH